MNNYIPLNKAVGPKVICAGYQALIPQKLGVDAITFNFDGSEMCIRDSFLGFAAAFTGIFLIMANGAFVLELNPAGDVLALGAVSYTHLEQNIPEKAQP